MRLYLPRVEARLRGITAVWFCRKKGHLHTIPCNEQEWDKELAYNRHFTPCINKSYIIQRTHIDRLRSNPNAGPGDSAPGDAYELKWEFDEDSQRYYVSFPDDQ